MGCVCAGPCMYAVSAFVTLSGSVITLVFCLLSSWDFKGEYLIKNSLKYIYFKTMKYVPRYM